MISVAEALAHVTSGVRLLSAEQVGVADALGRVLAEDVPSRVAYPPASASAMDGYAVRAADVAEAPATLRRIGESAPGARFPGAVGPGETVRIFTGAPVPEGADAIVIQENTESEGDTVTMLESAPAGRFVRPAGLDFDKDEVLLRAGMVLTARDVGLAAAMNVPWLKVRRRPRVAHMATGNEVVMPGEPLGPDQIVSSNSLALGAYVKVLGGEPIDLGIARDDEDSLRGILAGARGADLLVTLGGASVGEYDLVRKVLGDEGLDLTFFRVAMRPGKPLVFGRLGDVPVLGLPGNPVSVGVTSVLFLKPAIEVMLGIRGAGDAGAGPPATALLGRDLGENDHRQDYLRATLAADGDGALVATPFGKQDSAMMAGFAKADCLVVRLPHAPPAKAGKRVEIIRLREGMISI